MIALGFLLLMIGLSWLAYIYRDRLATWLPGIKHGLAGWPTALSGILLSLVEFLRGQDSTISILFAKHPEYPPLIMTGLGLVILILSWITPRAET